MTSKLIWVLIFGAGTASGGGAAFFLPERLWSNANLVMFYKKGNKLEDKTTLKVGGKDDSGELKNFQNTESLIRWGGKKWEDQSSNYGSTQNNSLWLIGKEHKRNESNNWNSNMIDKKKENNPSGSISFYLLQVNCDSLKKENTFNELVQRNNSQVKFSCQPKA